MTDWQTKSPATDRLTDREITATIPFFASSWTQANSRPTANGHQSHFSHEIDAKTKESDLFLPLLDLKSSMNSESLRDTAQCHGRDTDTKLDPKRISPRRGTWRRAEATTTRHDEPLDSFCGT